MTRLPLRLVLLTNIPAPYRIDLFEWLADAPGVSAHVVFCPGGASAAVRRLAVSQDLRFPHSQLPGLRLPRTDRWIQVSPARLLSRLFSLRPDVLVSGGFGLPTLVAVAYCRLTRAPLIIWTGGTARSEMRRSKPHRSVQRLLTKTAHSFLAYGPDSADFLAQLGVSRQRIFVAGNVTFDTCRYAKQIPSHAANSQHSSWSPEWPARYVLGVGQLVPRKNYRVLIEATGAAQRVAPHVGFGVVLVGSGPQESELRTLAQASGVGARVKFLGWRSQTELPPLYGAASLFAHPSLLDQWPQSVNEAMAAGLPVLASNRAGLPMDLIQPGVNGMLLDPLDSDSWMDAIVRLLSLAANELEAQGRASQTAIRRWDLEYSGRMFLETAFKAAGR